MSHEIKLTQDQQQALDNLMGFLFDDRKEIILQGHAGTGKTFLIKYVYEQYQKMIKLSKALNFKERHWTFLATTHKAVESLRQATGFKVNTVHSAWGMNTKDRQVREPDISLNAIVVIDECSYLNYEQLDIIRNDMPYKIIYMGDERQLPPVGLNHAPVFYDGIECITLNTVVRQTNAPMIAEYCEQLRKAISNNSSTPNPPKSDEIIWLSKSDFEQTMLDEFKQGCKVLACKNTTVLRYNKLIHKHLTGKDSLQIGDKVVSNNSTLYVRNNQYLTIKHIEANEIWKIKGLWLRFDEILEALFLPNSSRAYKQLFQKAYNAEIAWDFYHRLVDVRLPYASTIHKAQGSTYHTVFINLSELNQIKTRDEINRLLYVAFSRATHKVYITGKIP